MRNCLMEIEIRIYLESNDTNSINRGENIMTDQHCPGFESNKSLSEVKITCPECGKEMEIFSDELEKTIICKACNAKFTPEPKQ